MISVHVPPAVPPPPDLGLASLAGVCLPSFWLGLLLIFVFLIFLFIFILVVGYYYAWQKGALDWGKPSTRRGEV